ncbi:hypothetical protein A3Q56_05913 [Intoshia linei]|uniref:Uncharacterized protein n=1 Tax=Intoshia linei TaxID=1819745 RepID=A0A177AWG6_9BILA|nr:hypothetical protein A3Q56_05913 [Intoshia linei]
MGKNGTYTSAKFVDSLGMRRLLPKLKKFEKYAVTSIIQSVEITRNYCLVVKILKKLENYKKVVMIDLFYLPTQKQYTSTNVAEFNHQHIHPNMLKLCKRGVFLACLLPKCRGYTLLLFKLTISPKKTIVLKSNYQKLDIEPIVKFEKFSDNSINSLIFSNDIFIVRDLIHLPIQNLLLVSIMENCSNYQKCRSVQCILPGSNHYIFIYSLETKCLLFRYNLVNLIPNQVENGYCTNIYPKGTTFAISFCQSFICFLSQPCGVYSTISVLQIRKTNVESLFNLSKFCIIFNHIYTNNLPPILKNMFLSY